MKKALFINLLILIVLNSFTSLAVLPTGNIIAAYKLADGTDETGNYSATTISGTPTGDTNGMDGNSTYFTATSNDAYINRSGFNTSAICNDADGCSITGFFRKVDAGAGYVWTIPPKGKSRLFIDTDDTASIYFGDEGAGDTDCRFTGENLGLAVDSVWHGFQLVYYGTGTNNITFYLDSVQVLSKIGCDSIDNSNNSFYLGAYEHDDGVLAIALGGTADEFTIWDKALTVAEVLEVNSTFYPFGEGIAPDPPTFVSPTPSDGDTDNINQTINMSCDNGFRYFLWFDNTTSPSNIVLRNLTEGNWTMNISTDRTYYYRGACYNATNNSYSTNTSERTYILDISDPVITVNPPTAFNFSTNLSTIIQYKDVLFPLNLSFTDNINLFGFLTNITQGNAIVFNFTNLTLTGVGHNYSINLNTSTWDTGLYNIEIEVADTHTLSEINDYDISKFGNKITFRTEERNTISVSSSGAYTTKYNKLRDRYSFSFNYLFSGTSRTFTLKSDNKIYYLPESKYNVHFVILGNNMKGNWIDFEGIGNSYVVEKISDYEYEIRFTNLENEKEITLNSIGGLNTVTENYQWYKGGFTKTFSSSATTESLQAFTLNLTTLDGFVEDIDATFEYNNLERTITTTRTEESIFFKSEFNVPSNQLTYNFTWNVTVTQNDSSTYNFSVSDSQSVLLAQLNITFLDEGNQTLINESVTVFLTLEQTTQATSDSGSVLIGGLTLGEYFIQGESISYERRGIFLTIINQTQNLNLYLLKDELGNADIDYFVKSTSQRNIEDVRMTFQRTINNSLITVAQAETDFAGQTRVFQDQQHEYRIVLTHDNFPTKIITLRPLLTEYTIFLDELLVSLYDNVWEGIRYTLFPKQRLHNVSLTPLTIGIDILSTDSSLEYFGVLIDNHSFTCVPASCVSNITGSPAGGVAQVTILGNTTGVFDVHYFFKKSGFELQYITGDLFGFIIIAELFGTNLANWLNTFAEGLGGKETAKPMLAILAAVLTTVLIVIASQFGIIGIPLVLIAVFGNLFFMIAGFIPAFVAVVSTIVGLSIYFVLGRDG